VKLFIPGQTRTEVRGQWKAGSQMGTVSRQTPAGSPREPAGKLPGLQVVRIIALQEDPRIQDELIHQLQGEVSTNLNKAEAARMQVRQEPILRLQEEVNINLNKAEAGRTQVHHRAGTIKVHVLLKPAEVLLMQVLQKAAGAASLQDHRRTAEAAREQELPAHQTAARNPLPAEAASQANLPHQSPQAVTRIQVHGENSFNSIISHATGPQFPVVFFHPLVSP